MKIAYSIFTVFVICFFTACDNNKPYTKIEEKGETTYDISSEDEDINLARNKAKSTLSSFDSALVCNNINFSSFSLKVKFSEGEKIEHIWFSKIKKEWVKYLGIVDNTPVYITTIKLGDALEINQDDISDWEYYNKNKAVGSFTTKVIRKHMTEEDRKKFDDESQNAYAD